MLRKIKDALVTNSLNRNICNTDNTQQEITRYYSVDEFCNKRYEDSQYFSIFHLNIHSIEKHVEAINILINQLQFKFDFLCFTESKINKDTPPKIDISIPGYQDPVGMPTAAKKGGVLIYVKNGIDFKPRPDLNIYKDKELESFFIEVINPNNTKAIVGNIYRHPLMEPSEFTNDYLSPMVDKLSAENKIVYLAGDWNFNLLNFSTNDDTMNFIDKMMGNLIMPTITVPTRIHSNGGTLIDNIFTNNINSSITGNLTVSISDHLPSFILIPNPITKHTKKSNIYRRDTKNFNKTEFLLDYFTINWDQVIEIEKEDPNKSMKNFIKKLNKLVNKHMPLRKVTRKEQTYMKPWINQYLLRKIEKKNKIYRKFLKTKRSDYKEEAKRLNNEITSTTRRNKKEYYAKYFADHKNDLKKVWQGIKEIINIKHKSQNSPSCIKIGDKYTTDPTTISNQFNNYFSNIAGKILKEGSTVVKSPLLSF